MPKLKKALFGVEKLGLRSNESQEISESRARLMASLAYFLFVIPMVTKDNERSELVKFHINQAALFLLFFIAYLVTLLVASAFLPGVSATNTQVLSVLPERTWSMVLERLPHILMALTWLIPLSLWAKGIGNASRGEMKPLPLIGKHTIIS